MHQLCQLYIATYEECEVFKSQRAATYNKMYAQTGRQHEKLIHNDSSLCASKAKKRCHDLDAMAKAFYQVMKNHL